MKLKILEGRKVYNNGICEGVLQLVEGERSEPMLIIESAEWSDLKPVPLSETERHLEAQLVEAGKNGKLLAFEGRFQMSDTKNANGRSYPDSIWEKILTAGGKWMNRIKNGEMLGELDHPKDGETRLERVSHRITDMRRSPNNRKEIRGRLLVFDTERGKIAKAIHEGGGRLGVSSRGQGSVVRDGGDDIVQNDYDLDTSDLVHNPSTSGAYPEEVRENTSSAQPAQEISEMSRRLNDLTERLARFKERGASTLTEDTRVLITEEVTAIKEALTTEDFGTDAPKAGVAATEAVLLLRDLDEQKRVPEAPVPAPAKPAPKAKPAKRPATLAEAIEVLDEVSVDTEDLQEATRAVAQSYRDRFGIEGTLQPFEYDAVTSRAQALAEGTTAAERDGSPITARIYYGTNLTESHDEEISATSEADLRRSIAEKTEGREGLILVEIDRSEQIYRESADRFSPIIEQQILQRKQAVDEAAARECGLSETSAKLACALQVIENLGAKFKAAMSNLTEESGNAEASVALIDALSQEFPAERLRGVVEGIASTHHDLDGLHEHLAQCTTVEEAIAVTKRLIVESSPRLTREPLNEREEKINQTLLATVSAEQRLHEQRRYVPPSPQNQNQDATQTIVETTHRVADALKKHGMR